MDKDTTDCANVDIKTYPITTPSDPQAAKYYYECHITVEPVFSYMLEYLQLIAKRFGFQVADLLMQKRRYDTPERSAFDSFLTGRGKVYSELQSRMMALIDALKISGFKVWRYKIEDTLCDSKREDVYKLLGDNKS